MGIKKTLLGILIFLGVVYLSFIGYSVYMYWMEKDIPHLKEEVTSIQVEKIDKDTVDIKINHKYDHLICIEQE